MHGVINIFLDKKDVRLVPFAFDLYSQVTLYFLEDSKSPYERLRKYSLKASSA